MVFSKAYLASKSPRRLELLRSAFRNVEQIHSLLDEPKWDQKQSPKKYLDFCMSVKARGAREAYERIRRNTHAISIVVAADTIVVRGNTVFGKPEGSAGAIKMLSVLMGKEHEVRTGLYVALYEGEKLRRDHSATIVTKVKFRNASMTEIKTYVKTGEPLDKSGSYGVQGPAMQFVEWVDGSYASVMGLPLFETQSVCQRWQKEFF